MVEKLPPNGISFFLTYNLPLKNILTIASLASDNSIFKNKLPTGQALCEKKLKQTMDMMGMAYKTREHFSAATDDAILSTILSHCCTNTKTRRLWGG